MLASVLKSSVASTVSIEIMRTFVEMKKYISNGLLEQRYINNIVIKHDNDIKFLINKVVIDSLIKNVYELIKEKIEKNT